MADGAAILVVEDEAFNRGLLLRHLDREGYENVSEAENGRLALEVLRDGNFDLVLLDIQMPEMDGLEVLRAMRAEAALAAIPVIMISAVEELDSIVRCIELGAEDYLPKPFNPTILRARVGASLEKKRLRDREQSYLAEIEDEKRVIDELLGVILPAAAADELKEKGYVTPRRYENVALLFCDIVEFTAHCERRDAADVVANLQTLFEAFEDFAEAHGMEKIKTVGDEFMATANLLRPNPEPLATAARAGLAMAQAARGLDPGWEVRVGVNAGPVAAGIVGRQKYQFDVWGDTVNTASRMAGIGNPSAVAMTLEAWRLIQDGFEGRSLGAAMVKGKGEVTVMECFAER